MAWTFPTSFQPVMCSLINHHLFKVAPKSEVKFSFILTSFQPKLIWNWINPAKHLIQNICLVLREFFLPIGLKHTSAEFQIWKYWKYWYKSKKQYQAHSTKYQTRKLGATRSLSALPAISRTEDRACYTTRYLFRYPVA